MRIGIDIHAAERDGSGNCTYIRNLVLALLSIDSENEYFLYVTDPAHPFYGGIEGRWNAALRPIGAKNPFVRVPFLLPRAAARDRVDVLHVQYIGPPFYRGALVATIHDLGFLRVPETFSRFFVWRSKVFVRRTARRAARIITGTEASRADIIRTYGLAEDKVELVPCGIGPEFFESPDESRISEVLKRLGLDRPYILSVGRLNPRKNLPALARAFARFKDRTGLRHKLVIAGKQDFDARRTIAEIEAAGPDIVLAGYVADEDLPHLYRGAEMLVYPSLFEGVGLPVLEAMAAGVPAITSMTSSMPETAGDAALIVDPDDEAAIAEAIERLAGDKELRRTLIEKGRQRAASFTWEAAARQTLEVYRAAGVAGRLIPPLSYKKESSTPC